MLKDLFHLPAGPLLALMLSISPSPTLALNILVFDRTEGFTHASIPDGIAMIGQIATEESHSVTVTQSPNFFSPKGLAPFDVVVFLSTTGDVLGPSEQISFERYIQAGGGYVGIHAAADCEYDWPWYGQLLGNDAWFLSHPSIQEATLVLEDPDHPAAGTFAASTAFTDEWYNFRNNPRPVVDVIMTLDENSYDPGSGAMGADHPIAWAHEFDGGRAFYTALGHRSETFQDPRFKEQIRDALAWAGAIFFGDGFELGSTSNWSAVVLP